MSKTEPNVPVGKLPLPSPRSPDELDRRILHAARDRAPEPQSNHQPWWMAGAATASILLVAVTITWNEQPPTVRKAAEPISADIFSSQKPLQAPNSESEEVYDIDVKNQRVNQAIVQPAAANHGASADSFPQETAPDHAAAVPIRVREAESQRSLSTAARLNKKMAAETIAMKLQALSKLIAKGEGERAQMEYLALKNACSDCGLPERLEQALVIYNRVE